MVRTLRAELGGDVRHHVAFGTNYTREGINSKIIENYRTDNPSSVQFTDRSKLCRRGLPLVPTPTNYLKKNSAQYSSFYKIKNNV